MPASAQPKALMQKEDVSDTIIPLIALLPAREYPLRGGRLFFLLREPARGITSHVVYLLFGAGSFFPFHQPSSNQAAVQAVENNSAGLEAEIWDCYML